MQFYDTHAHVNSSEYGEEYKDIIQRTLQEGVWFNNIGTNKTDSAESVRIAGEYAQGVYASVGLHPSYVIGSGADGAIEEFDFNAYAQLASEKKVVGIGECGLDYYRIPEGMSLEEVRAKQSEVFSKHIDLANQTGKVLIIHCRASKNSEDAYEDAIRLLKNNKPEKVLLHSFTSSWHICQEFLNLGAYIAFNGIITFDKSGILAESAIKCPMERLVLETDAPYLAPAPFRSKRNEPLFVKQVAEKIADLRKMPLGDAADRTFENAKNLFKI